MIDIPKDKPDLYSGLMLLRLAGGESELVGHAHQLDQRLRSHFSHDLATMDLRHYVANAPAGDQR